MPVKTVYAALYQILLATGKKRDTPEFFLFYFHDLRDISPIAKKKRKRASLVYCFYFLNFIYFSWRNEVEYSIAYKLGVGCEVL